MLTTLPPNNRWSFPSKSQGADSTQGKDEIIATFDNGIGGVDTMVRNGKALTLKVGSKSGEVEGLEWKDKSAFNYDTKRIEEGKGIVSAGRRASR